MSRKHLVVGLLLLALHGAIGAHVKAPRSRISHGERGCSQQLTEQACLSQDCFFCEGQVQGNSGCFEESRLVPKSFYSCKGSKLAQQREAVAFSIRKESGNPSDPCEGKADAKSCDDLAECTWCKSAAVPSSCFTVAQAKFLPPAVFVCDKKPTSVSRRS